MSPLVRKEFTFKPSVTEAANRAVDRLLQSSAAANDSVAKLVRVGIHVRRSDMAMSYHLRRGYVVADQEYIEHAMHYVEQRLLSSSATASKSIVGDGPR